MKAKLHPFPAVSLAIAAMFILSAHLSTARGEGATYDAVGDFTTNSNPNGVWSYLWATKLGDAPQPLDRPSAPFSDALLITRWDNQLAQPNWCGVVANHGTNTYSYLTIRYEPDVLCLDPQYHAVMVRFTAPMAGQYSVQGLFRLIDTSPHAHNVQVRRNNTEVLSSQDTTGGSFGAEYPFSFTSVELSGQDTLDFVVSATGDFAYLSTGLKVAVSPALPPLARVGCLGTNFTFSFQTMSQAVYTVEYNDDLSTTNWQFQESVTGDGSLMPFLVPVTNGARRFFRVRQP